MERRLPQGQCFEKECHLGKSLSLSESQCHASNLGASKHKEGVICT